MVQRTPHGFRFPKDKYDNKLALYENFRYLEQYLTHLSKSDKFAAHFIIAAADSENPARAHYRCDGSADQEVIQEAVNALPSPGGHLVFLDGTYNTTNFVNLPVEDSIMLTGLGATFNLSSSGTGGWLAGIDDDGNSNALYIVQGFRVTGGLATAQIMNGGGNWVVRNNHFYSVHCDMLMGAKALNDISRWIITDNQFRDIHLQHAFGFNVSGIFVSDNGGSRSADGIFANNIVDNVFATLDGGNSAYVVYSEGDGQLMTVVGNNVDMGTGMTGFVADSALAAHNVVDNVMVAGEHNIALDDLTDVVISAVTNNEVLAWDTGTSRWINQTAAEADLMSPTSHDTHDHTTALGTAALGDLADVGVGTPTAGNLLEGDGDSWESVAPSTMDAADFGSGAATDGYLLTADGAGGAAFEAPVSSVNEINDLTDVTITSVADGELLVYDLGTTDWINQTISEFVGVDLTVGEWQPWTPTFVNFTLGNGTVTARYTQIGTTVVCRGQIALGSTSSMSTGPTISLPVTSSSTGYSDEDIYIGKHVMLEGGVQRATGTIVWKSTSTAGFVNEATSGSYNTLTGITSTAPFTWGNTDSIGFLFTYEAATSVPMEGIVQAELLDVTLDVGEWAPWTPTLTNLTLGNGTVTARYSQDGSRVHAYITFTMGSTSAVSGTPTFSLPVEASASYTDSFNAVGTGKLLNAGVTTWPASLRLRLGTPDTIEMFQWDAAGAAAIEASIAATSPHTWGTGDAMALSFTYEAATSVPVSAVLVQGAEIDIVDDAGVQTTFTNSSFTDLGSLTGGTTNHSDMVATVNVKSSGILKVTITAGMFSNTGGHAALLGFVLSGANTLAANAIRSLYYESSNAGDFIRMSAVHTLTGLNAGSTSVELQASQFGGGTSGIERINLTVEAL